MTPCATIAEQQDAGGLSSVEAAARLRRDGPNAIQSKRGHSAAALLIQQFRSPLVLILVIAAVVSGVVQQWLEGGIILAIVLGSTLLGFVQEYRASAAVEALQRRLALNARVRRDGQIRTIPFEQIVAGDRVLLSAGAVVPADALVLEAVDLLVSEAALTGESFPVEKRPNPATAQAPTADQMVFLGTSVRSGTAETLVLRTGLATRYGAIAARLKAKPLETDFARGIRRFGEMLIRVMLVVVILVLIANQLLGRPFLDSLLFSVALGVGLSPELLPAVVSVTLAAGARDLARNGVIVRRLEAMENLGGMTVFCTDKTGTLTEGDIMLKGALDPAGQDSAAVRRLAFINAAFETGIENPLDQAVVAAGQAGGLTTAGFTKIDEIPYDFIRRRLSIVVQSNASGGDRQMISKGAFEAVLAQCSTVSDGQTDAPLTPERQAVLEAWYRARGEEGLRVLAVATRRLPPQPDYGMTDEVDMRFEGFLTFMDPPKAEAVQAITDLAALGVSVKVLSGDNRHVVAYVARALGLASDALLTGADIAALKDEALWVQVERTVLFAEVDPQQKERIVRALQRRGQSVGYLGDGINDAPALSAADVGVSVEQAVDVARESADVVLLKRDLGVLKRGVEGGRRTFANTLKYLSITISGNFGNMVSMAVATPFLPFLPMLAKQILLNNFLSGLPSMAISSDAVDPEQLQVAQRIGTADIQRYMLVFGLISSPFDLITFVLLLQVFHAPQSLFQTAWFVMSLLTELAVVMVLRTRGRAWKSRPGRWLVWTSLAVAAVALASPYLGPVSRLFGFTPLSPLLMAAMLGVVCAYVAVTETAKAWFFRDARRRAAKRPEQTPGLMRSAASQQP
ncbi:MULTISPECIES: magnesium-translocating P-type ATPase [unclassified Brevundimonas]|uniref:magnesium-translocating P-type ATPase n=1 Tax=unclassified Brevundimonas TaxID=2622653 RepID=UPI003F93052C